MQERVPRRLMHSVFKRREKDMHLKVHMELKDVTFMVQVHTKGAFFGTGGTKSQMKAPLSSPKHRISCDPAGTVLTSLNGANIDVIVPFKWGETKSFTIDHVAKATSIKIDPSNPQTLVVHTTG